MDRLMKKLNNTSPALQKKKGIHFKTFGVPLEELVRRAIHTDGVVPDVVVKICDYLTQRGLDMQGIFRVNGSSKVIETMRISFDTNADVDISSCNDVYAMAGLLKLFLRELPDGLIPERLTIDFTMALTNYKEDIPTCLSEMGNLLSQLPVDNYNLLKYLCQFLALVAQNEIENRMTSTSLGIVFGPNVFRCGRDFEGLMNQGTTNRIMTLFIDYHPTLFKMSAPSHSNIIQVKECSTRPGSNSGDSHHRTSLPAGSHPTALGSRNNANGLHYHNSPKSEDNSIESPRPKPRLSLQIPMGNDVRISNRVSDEDFRAASPFSMDTENDGSLISPRLSVDMSSHLQQVIRQCVVEHLFSPSHSDRTSENTERASWTTRNSLHLHGNDMQDEEESAMSATSDSLVPAPSPRLSKITNGGSGKLGADRRNNNIKNYSTLPHDTGVQQLLLDDLDWISGTTHEAKGRRGEVDRSPRSGGQHQNSQEIMEVESPTGADGANRKMAPGNQRPKVAVRKPRLAFQESADDDGNAQPNANQFDISSSHSPTGDTIQLKSTMGNSHEDVSDALRQTTKKIQTLKRQIRQYEESFEQEHGWKPTQAQKNSIEEVRQWMSQLAEARKQLKFMKSGTTTTYSSLSLSTQSRPAGGGQGNHTLTNISDKIHTNGAGTLPSRPLSSISDVSGTGHPDNHENNKEHPRLSGTTEFIGDSGTKTWSGRGNLGMTGSRHRTPSNNTLNSSVATGVDSEDGVEPVFQGNPDVKKTYDTLMLKLAEKRQSAGRPEKLEEMSRSQIELEKLAIQKALLYFENLYGRPRDNHEKMLMKPLYDRYRLVKRYLAGDVTIPNDQQNTEGADMGSTTLQRSTSKTSNGPIITIPTGEPGGGLSGGTTDFIVTQDWTLLRGDRHFGSGLGGTIGRANTMTIGGDFRKSNSSVSKQNDEDSGGAGSSSKQLYRSATLNPKSSSQSKQQTSSKKPSEMSRNELLEEQKLVKEEKRSLQKLLKDYEHEFEEVTGHKVGREDRLPMRSEYNRYKQIKSRLKLLESLVEKTT